jgi:hypothetical protein
MDVVEVSNEPPESLLESLYWARLRGNHGRWRLRLFSHEKESRSCKANGHDALYQYEIVESCSGNSDKFTATIFLNFVSLRKYEKDEDLTDKNAQRC